VTEEAKASHKRPKPPSDLAETLRRLEEEAKLELEEDSAVSRESLLDRATQPRAAPRKASS
jgi:hypothetical protein